VAILKKHAMKVFIAYDGSPRSDAALDDLRRAGLGLGVQAELVAVAEVWIPPESSYSGPTIVELALRDIADKGRAEHAEVTRRVGAAAERLRALFPDWNVAAHVLTGPAALKLIEHAERVKPDLVVVGAQGHMVSERLAMGSVALRVLTHLRCAVRVARPLGGRPDHLRIAVASDGSSDADAAVAAVARRSWPAGSEARVITAVHHRVLAPLGGDALPPDPFTTASAEQIANRAADRLRLAGLKTSTKIVSGDPKYALVGAAREWDADCVFCGARGLSRAERFLLGSVSTSLAMNAPCSVEVVHPAGGGKDGST
jgi:nucleotide-binding universal stress UspA family protein